MLKCIPFQCSECVNKSNVGCPASADPYWVVLCAPLEVVMEVRMKNIWWHCNSYKQLQESHVVAKKGVSILQCDSAIKKPLW